MPSSVSAGTIPTYTDTSIHVVKNKNPFKFAYSDPDCSAQQEHLEFTCESSSLGNSGSCILFFSSPVSNESLLIDHAVRFIAIKLFSNNHLYFVSRALYVFLNVETNTSYPQQSANLEFIGTTSQAQELRSKFSLECEGIPHWRQPGKLFSKATPAVRCLGDKANY